MSDWEQSASGAWTRFTEDVRGRILAAVRVGNYPGVAAASAGISGETLKKWRERGKAEAEAELDTDYAHFYFNLLDAEAALESRLITPWVRAAEDGDWEAGMKFLERRFPKRWAKRTEAPASAMTGASVSIYLPDNERDDNPSSEGTTGSVPGE